MNTEVKKILENFTHSTLQKNLLELGAIKKCEIVNHHLTINLTMPFAWQSTFEELKKITTPELLKLNSVNEVDWHIEYKIATLKRANNQNAINNIKNIIAISSGKGGVGKSSTAVNLALALQKQGAKVGILDADIYGPSIPTMLGTEKEHPLTPDNKHMTPIMAYKLASNSIGYLVDPDSAMVWRGPMASKALLQILQDTLWPELDYLVIDMPPGTGDIQLTLAQNIPVTAAVIVSTPQDIALIDAKKGITMFNKVNIPTLGIIENMSYHICENCGHHETIFGEGGAQSLANQYQTKLLGQVPLHKTLRQDLDTGKPTVISHPNSEFTQLYCQIAERIASELYWQGEAILPDIAFKAL
ncbi:MULTISPECIES: iron-sulfur cluster carrier protein ApbC [unclassified Gilliamella]|uniref:iron-sulfur cluster carrier protein ApbC n=1 Tax=unclassified Gilliamella TaxID=2685620 RepID=UPI00130C3A22|nr:MULTISPECIES: iron-sulfur cluster carrier protein ApbC [unclassified Gilliamella]MWP48217.1 iron-sulfur cluster carrier protein ApbC [Gilliamella sp. Lep-s35]MWP68137.1 iron-sulfur cluster carrier protein ApbC [Gilliamella sp. Lep-s5]MWP76357.1 iron-sulfur cluster carrier protein ApbC [Gilliamella sp. Lep-s21]